MNSNSKDSLRAATRTLHSSKWMLLVVQMIVVIAIGSIEGTASAQGKLSRVRKAVRKVEEPKEKKAKRKKSSRSKPGESRRRSGSGINLGFLFASSPRPSSQVYVQEVHHIYEPVVEPIPINAISEQVVDQDPGLGGEFFSDPFRTSVLRSTIWYGAGVDDISQGGFDLLLQVPGSLGLEGSIRNVRERGFSDHIWLGDLNLVFEPINTNRVRIRAGVGLNFLSDFYGGETGLNLTVGFDSRLTSRLIMAGEFDYGNLGASDYTHGQISLGYRLQRSELVVGYDHIDLGGVDLQSPFIGLRFRY